MKQPRVLYLPVAKEAARKLAPAIKPVIKEGIDFLSAAVSGKAQYIVTKNKNHFPRDLTSVKIVNVREFLNELER